MNIKKTLDKNYWIIFIAFCILIFFLLWQLMIYLSSNNEHYIHYGDEDYIFVTVGAMVGDNKLYHSGTIKVDDYNRWKNGKNEILYVYSTRKEYKGSVLWMHDVVEIINYGSKPERLNSTFWY